MRKWIATAAILLLPVSASAQWGTFPNGEAFYTNNYVITPSLTCLEARFLTGTCTRSGNTLTLTSKEGTATMSVTGPVSGTVLASGLGPTVHLGTLTTTYTGNFLWPEVIPAPFLVVSGSAAIYLRFHIALPTLGQGGSVGWNYTANSSALTSLVGATAPFEFIAPLLNTPPNLGYRFLVWTIDRPTNLTAGSPQSIDIVARVGIIPEPSTYALMAMGLLGLALAARRRHAREEGATQG